MSCPTVPALEAMLKGPVEAFRDMEAHVEKCDECLTKLESLAGHSTVLHDLRVGSSILSEATSTTVSEEIITQTWKPAQIESIDTLSELPRQLDRYEVRSLLGEGGMGQVYLAWDPQLKRQVAIKILRVAPDERPEWTARFRQEVEVIASLQHPQIIEVYDMCFQADRPYFVMEYLEGGSLSDRLSRQLLSIPDACLLIRQLALAIDAAHQHGIIHRDLKPSNILFSSLPPSSHPISATTGSINECQPKISDFGLAKRLEQDISHNLETKSGLILGTPGYMAPEQSLSQTRVIAPTLDVYSLGAIFYECLTGRPPFKGASVFETLHQSLYEDPLPPRRLRQELSPDLQAVCLKCLNRIPEQRYASGKKLAEDIDRYLAGQPTLARPVSTIQRAVKWCRRSPVVAGLLALLALLILSTVALMAWYTVQLNTSLQDKIAEERRATQAQTKADEGYRLARGTIMTILKRAKESPHAAIPQLLELERTQYEDALGFFRQAIQNDKLADPRLRIELAEAITLLAACNTQVNRVDDAVAGYREAAAIYEELLQNDRQSPLLQYQKAFCLGQIGYLLLWTRPVDAEPVIKESVSQLEALVHSQPEADTQTWFRLAHSHHNWGMLCRRANRLDEAKEHYDRSIEINQQHPHVPQKTQQERI
ncbi:MAG: protein kinase [Gemmatales bacterium]